MNAKPHNIDRFEKEMASVCFLFAPKPPLYFGVINDKKGLIL